MANECIFCRARAEDFHVWICGRFNWTNYSLVSVLSFQLWNPLSRPTHMWLHLGSLLPTSQSQSRPMQGWEVALPFSHSLCWPGSWCSAAHALLIGPSACQSVCECVCVGDKEEKAADRRQGRRWHLSLLAVLFSWWISPTAFLRKSSDSDHRSCTAGGVVWNSNKQLGNKTTSRQLVTHLAVPWTAALRFHLSCPWFVPCPPPHLFFTP